MDELINAIVYWGLIGAIIIFAIIAASNEKKKQKEIEELKELLKKSLNSKEQDEELQALREENRLLKEQNAILLRTIEIKTGNRPLENQSQQQVDNVNILP